MVASRESAVRACPCPNSPTSAASNRPEPASTSRYCRDRPAPPRHLVSVMLDLRLLISASRGDPADPVVVHVPQPGEHPARPEHPGDLGQRAVHVEPVHRLPGQHGVEAGVGQRDLFRAPRHRTHRGHRPPQLGQHLRVGLHRGHLGAQADQRRGQLAGTRRRCRPPGPAGGPGPAPAPTAPRPRHSRGGARRRRPRRRRTTSRAAAGPPPRPRSPHGSGHPGPSARSPRRAYSAGCRAS